MELRLRTNHGTSKIMYFIICILQPPVTNAFPPSSNFGAPVYNPGMNQPTSTNPFETPAALQSPSGILQPMNKVQAKGQELEAQRQTSTGDLHSSLSKVAKSLGM